MARANRRPLTAEQQALAADPRHLRLARVVAMRRAVRAPGRWQEFEAAALYGLVEAARGYDPGMGVRFATYARGRIDGAILDWLREFLPVGVKRLPADDRPGTVTGLALRSRYGDPGLAWDRFASGEEPADAAAAAADEFLALTADLPERERAAVRAYYGEAGATMKAIARRLELTESRVSQMVTAALGRLRDQPAVRRRAGAG
jgi:RNA polymerase sigma factor (sigma-70 family)